jgi:uncharacterized protein
MYRIRLAKWNILVEVDGIASAQTLISAFPVSLRLVIDSYSEKHMFVGLVGATGSIGSTVLDELVRRGHTVTAIARNVEKLTASDTVKPLPGDMTVPSQLAELLTGHDVVISAASFTTSSSAGLVEAVRMSGVRRYIVVGGAGSLEVATGKRLIDILNFPSEVLPYVEEGIEMLRILHASTDLDWTYFSPPAEIGPGERTGHFRLGKDSLIKDEAGKSSISYPDYAIALVDEIENPSHIRARFTIGYWRRR